MPGVYRYTFVKFVKDWMLVIGMVAGAGLYLLYHSLPSLHTAGPFLLSAAHIVQPCLLFAMLFLSFCKIEPSHMKPHKWMIWLLLIQGLTFTGIALLLHFVPDIPHRLTLEAFMLCMICPTATACAVVTGKLGGNMAGVVTYTVLVNLMVSLLVPALVPLVCPMNGMSFHMAFCKILAKVFPLLILPLLLAWMVRYLLPKLHSVLLRYSSISFYIWSVSLMLAIAMSTRALVSSGEPLAVLTDIALASLVSCFIQFWSGRRIGALYGCKISAGQSIGQKNTVFGIWMGYTFLNPVVSISCGFYSIWHNTFNTWQLYRKRIEKSIDNE